MMDNAKIGKFISELRHECNMTQKDLAEKLGVTDKAVSKWERGAGYPEITLLPKLAEILKVTEGELLLGEHTSDTASDATLGSALNDASNGKERVAVSNRVVHETIHYVESVHAQKAVKAGSIAFGILSGACLVAIFVCMLCNFIINGRFDWSLYVVGGTAAGWLVALPLFKLKKLRFVGAMAAFTIVAFPVMVLIESLSHAGKWIYSFTLPITVASVACLWITVILFTCTHIRRIYLAAIMFIIYGVGLNLGISSFVSSFLENGGSGISVPIVAISSGFAAVVLVVVGIIKKNPAH